MSGYFSWELAERDPWNPDDDTREWRCVPHLGPTLGPATEDGGSPGSGMNLDGTMSCVLAMNWDTPPRLLPGRGVTEHGQVEVEIDGDQVPVDRVLADLISVLNGAGARTVTSCQGGEWFPPYVMFESPESGAVFLRLWRKHVDLDRYPVPVLLFEIQDRGWRDRMAEFYPAAARIPADQDGFCYTATWTPTHDSLLGAIRSLCGGA